MVLTPNWVKHQQELAHPRLQTTLIVVRTQRIDETNQEVSYSDLESVLRLADSRTPPGKTHRGGARGSCPWIIGKAT